MIEILQGYPDEVLAVSGTGRVTEPDYRDVLIPKADARIAHCGSVGIPYLLGPGYDDLDPAAAWSDVKFGVSRWSKFGHIALVTDMGWIRDAACLIAPFFHHALRIFGIAEPHRILGACSQHYAFEAPSEEPHIGVMLPCNVIVQRFENGEIDLSSIDPVVAMRSVGNASSKASRARCATLSVA